MSLLAYIFYPVAAGAGLITGTGNLGHYFVRGRFHQRLDAWAWAFPTVFWVLALVVALVEGLMHGDWVHMYWSTQVPMFGLFLCSGVYLGRSLDRASAFDRADPGQYLFGSNSPAWIPTGVWGVLGMIWALALVPLFSLTVTGDRPGETTLPGGPAGALWALVEWSFHAPRPAFLDPVNASQAARGMGHPQRDVTVTLGPTLIAAWFTVVTCCIALVGQCLSRGRVRQLFFLVVPILAGLGWRPVLSRALGGLPAWADLDLVGARRRDGIWRSTEPVLHSYGRVLLAALLSVCLLSLIQLTQRWIRRTRAARAT